jgi:uncharacterized protein YcbK (DUF882 family)
MCAKYPPLSSTLCKIAAVELTKKTLTSTSMVATLPPSITVPNRVNAINRKESINELNEGETMIANFDEMREEGLEGLAIVRREERSQDIKKLCSSKTGMHACCQA